MCSIKDYNDEIRPYFAGDSITLYCNSKIHVARNATCHFVHPSAVWLPVPLLNGKKHVNTMVYRSLIIAKSITFEDIKSRYSGVIAALYSA